MHEQFALYFIIAVGPERHRARGSGDVRPNVASRFARRGAHRAQQDFQQWIPLSLLQWIPLSLRQSQRQHGKRDEIGMPTRLVTHADQQIFWHFPSCSCDALPGLSDACGVRGGMALRADEASLAETPVLREAEGVSDRRQGSTLQEHHKHRGCGPEPDGVLPKFLRF